MNLISTVLLCALASSISNGWLQDLVSQRGLDVGSGLTLHLETNDSVKNTSFLEKHTLRLGYDGYGITVGKKEGKEAIEVGFYENENGEGRGKKMGDMIVPIMMGFKMTGLVTFTFTLVAAFVIKALGIAKLALISASIVTLLKLFSPEPYYQSHPPVIEVDHAASDQYAMVSGTGEEMGYHPSASANIYAYNNNIIPPSAIASETAMHYATVDAPATNNSVVVAPAAQQTAAVARRRDFAKKKLNKPIITIHRYSIET